MRALLLLLLLLLASSLAGPVYHNQFAVRVPAGRARADDIAARHGFTNLGQIGELPGYYLFEHRHVHKRSLTPSEVHRHKLSSEPEVLWVQQQHEKVRKKRDFVELQPAAPDVLSARREIYSGYLEPDGQEEKILSPQHGRETVFYTCNEKEMMEQTRYCKAHEHFNTSVTGDTAKDWSNVIEFPQLRKKLRNQFKLGLVKKKNAGSLSVLQNISSWSASTRDVFKNFVLQTETII